MTWPSIDEFEDAMLDTGLNFASPDLKNGELITDALGEPVSWAGSFAVAYKIVNGQKQWAVRIFIGEVSDQKRRYERIQRHLAKYGFPFIPEFVYLDEGLRVGGSKYPIVKMEWVEGQTLGEWVEDNYRKRDALLHLAEKWKQMIIDLYQTGAAHADIHHDNVIVTKSGELQLIDFDGTFVPEMAGEPPAELGHPNWNHPGRYVKKRFGGFLDQFPGFVGLLSILAVAENPRLFQKYYSGENLIFNKEDYKNLKDSKLYQELLAIRKPVNGYPPVRDLAERLSLWCQYEIDCIDLPKVLLGAPQVDATTEDWWTEADASVRIITDPVGAAIMIDNTHVGYTDAKGLKASVGKGPIEVEARALGYRPHTEIYGVERDGAVIGPIVLAPLRSSGNNPPDASCRRQYLDKWQVRGEERSHRFTAWKGKGKNSHSYQEARL
jgi:hypothetical protein